MTVMGRPTVTNQSVDIFVPGRLQNPKNWHAWGVWKHRRYVKDWRERTGQYLLAASLAFPGRHWPWPPRQPKAVHFHACTMRPWDDDGLAFGLVGARDALIDMQLVHDDGPTSGHTFHYTQEVNRSAPGVRVTIVPIIDTACGGVA
jgi:hypothetical protein